MSALAKAIEFLEAFEAQSLLDERESIGITTDEATYFEAARKTARAAHDFRAVLPPTFTAEEVEMAEAPWSYLAPTDKDSLTVAAPAAQPESTGARGLIADMLSAMEYHVEQTRPVQSTAWAIEAAREFLKAAPAARLNLMPVIQWLENGCDPKEAAKELRIYQAAQQEPAQADAREALTDEQLLAIARDEAGGNTIKLTRDVGPYEVTEVTHVYRCIARAIERAHGIGQAKPAGGCAVTTIREYRCNLCRDAIHDGREGFGVHFSAWKPEVKRPGLSFKRAAECENHICLACAKAVHDEVRKVTPAEPSGGAA